MPDSARTDDEHTIPPKLDYDVLRGLVLDRDPLSEEEIRRYVESQSHGTKVLHVEKMRTEYVFAQRHDVWDVHMEDGRWWVITSPTNLYPQELFPSLDYTLSLHVGVTARVLSRERTNATPAEEARTIGAFRRWEQAYDALDRADEAEEFQAVGNHCRMALLDLVGELARSGMVPVGQSVPQRDNFIAWFELIADATASGPSAERIRGYLKSVGRETWQLAGWLTHAKDAARHDARLVVDATLNLIQVAAAATIRYEMGSPDRCVNCGSYRLRQVHVDEAVDQPQLTLVCEKCGAVALSET